MEQVIDREKQVNQAREYLKKCVNEIKDVQLNSLASFVTNTLFFWTTPGSRKGHHSFDGGLAVHTAEVMEIALGLAKAQCLKINIDILITGILWHDYGKVFDYGAKQEDGSYKTKIHYSMIRHLTRSYAEFMTIAKDYILSEELKTSVGHCILAHHGRQEWGSPIEPQTVEAMIIHYADMLSAQHAKDYYERN